MLEASEKLEAVRYGYLGLAFIAGYNVDCFLKRLESIAQTIWGIKKSRVGKDSEVSKEAGGTEGAE